MTAVTNARNLRQSKSRFFIAELILAFDSNPNMVKNLSPKIKQIVSRCVVLLNVLIRSLELLNSKQLHQKLYPNSLYIIDITCNFL